MSRIYRNITPIIIILIWLMPVSNVLNTLNEDMTRNCYILIVAALAFVFCVESNINKRQMSIAAGILIVLGLSKILTVAFNNRYSSVSYGYLFNYLPFCILINLRPKKLCKSKTLDFLLVFSSILIIAVGILTIIGNSTVEYILKTYYINHYAHVYTVMWKDRKTVTFFATHSIACYVYYMLWWMLDYRLSIKKDLLSKILIIGMLFCIAMCLSNSTILTLGIIFGIYYVRWTRNCTRKNLFRSFILIAIAIILVILNWDVIDKIFNSSANGLAGRIGKTGNLNPTIKYAASTVIPFGLCDIKDLWLTDGGYFVNFIRGGLPLIALFYTGLYFFLKRNIKDRERRLELFVGLMLFEVGYQFTMCMRFFLVMLYLILYYNNINEYKEHKFSHIAN